MTLSPTAARTVSPRLMISGSGSSPDNPPVPPPGALGLNREECGEEGGPKEPDGGEPKVAEHRPGIVKNK